MEWGFGTPLGPRHQNDPSTGHSGHMAEESEREKHHRSDDCPRSRGGYVNQRTFNFAKRKTIMCYLSLRLHIITKIAQARGRISPAEGTGLINPTASTQEQPEEGKCCSISSLSPSPETLCEGPLALNQRVPGRQEMHPGGSASKAGAAASLAIITFLQVPVSISL